MLLPYREMALYLCLRFVNSAESGCSLRYSSCCSFLGVRSPGRVSRGKSALPASLYAAALAGIHFLASASF